MPLNNTGNPVPSSSPLDREDNTKVYDELVNSKDKDEVAGRLGDPLKTWHKIQKGIEEQLIAGGRIFYDEEQGRAAVLDGQYFYAESADPGVSRTLWRRTDASNSEKIADDPSAEFVLSIADDLGVLSTDVDLLRAMVNSGNVTEYDYVVTDSDGFIAIAIDKDGEFYCFSLNLISGESVRTDDAVAFSVIDGSGNSPLSVGLDGTTRVQDIEIPGRAGFYPIDDERYAYAIADARGNIAFAVTLDGSFETGAGNFSNASDKSFEIYEINHVLHYGQSLSLGLSPTLTTVQNYDNLMFEGGVTTRFSDDNPSFYDSLVPHVEISRETPASGFCIAVDELILSESHSISDYTYQFMSTVDGDIGRSVTELSRGGVEYTRMMKSVAEAYALAQSQGKSYAVTALTYTQGERDYVDDTPPLEYKTKLSQLFDDVVVDTKAITGQDSDLALISYQTGSHLDRGDSRATIALAQLELSNERDDYVIACPMYMFDYEDDVHTDSPSTKAFGMYYGIAYKRIFLDKAGFMPLQPVGYTVSGDSIILLRMNVPRPPMQFDTTQVVLNDDYGFKIVDSLGSDIGINSVDIISEDTVKITSSSPISSGYRLRYALDTNVPGGQSGRTDGARGNLRDSQGEDIVLEPSGLNRRMDNWCVMFEIKL